MKRQPRSRLALALVLGVVWTVPAAAQQQGLTGELYNPGRGVKLEDIRTDDTLHPVQVNGWWGHMNVRGDLVVFPQFEWSDYEFDGMLRVVVGGRTGFLNAVGNWSIEPGFVWADRFSEGVAVVRDARGVGLVDKAGKWLVEPRERNGLRGAQRFSEGLAAVQLEDSGLIGFIDRRGVVVVRPRFARARNFREGLAMVEAANERGQVVRGYIDKRGQMTLVDERGSFQDLGDFHEGLAPAKSNGRWGFVDKTLRLRVPARFDAVKDFSDGVAPVVLEGRAGYIDKTGELIAEPVWRSAEEFSDGVGMVGDGERFGYVDRAGGVRVAPRYTEARPFFRRYARVVDPSPAVGTGPVAGPWPAFGYVGVTGNVVWDPRQPLDVIWDRTSSGLAKIAVDLLEPTKVNGSVVRLTRLSLAPPAPREALPGQDLRAEPYPPEYLFEPELPGWPPAR